MTDQSNDSEPPPDAPIRQTGAHMTAMLVALVALVLVAVGAFWLIGTRPHGAPVIMTSTRHSDPVTSLASYPARTSSTSLEG